MADAINSRRAAASTDADDQPKEPMLGLSIPQLMGGALAASTAAAIGSRLGVAGTVLGAALVSVVAAVGGALYTRTIRSTSARVSGIVRRPGSGSTRVSAGDRVTGTRTTAASAAPERGPRRRDDGTLRDTTAPLDAADQPAAAYQPEAEQTRALPIGERVREPATPSTPTEAPGGSTAVPADPKSPARRFKVAHLLAAAAAVFVLAGLLVTGFEALTGNALSGGRGTTVSQIGSGGSGGGTGEPTPTPRATAQERSGEPSARPSGRATPGDEPTARSSQAGEPTQRPTGQASQSGEEGSSSKNPDSGSGSGSGSNGSSGGGSGSGSGSGAGSGSGGSGSSGSDGGS